MNTYFSWSRFVNLLKFDFNLNKKKYFLAVLAIFVLLVFASYLVIDDQYKINKSLVSYYSFKYKLSNYRTFCAFCYITLAAIIVCNAFNFLRDKRETSQYLVLPASTFEKFICEFFIRIVVFNILFVVLFWLSFKISGYAFVQYHIYNPVDVNLYRLLEIPNFGLFDQFKSTTNDLDRNVALLALFSLSTFMLAGASYFNKYSFFKTILTFGGLLLFAYFINLATYHIILPNKVDVFDIEIIDRKISDKMDTDQLAMYLMGAISSLFLLPFAYFKLKEKEV